MPITARLLGDSERFRREHEYSCVAREFHFRHDTMMHHNISCTRVMIELLRRDARNRGDDDAPSRDGCRARQCYTAIPAMISNAAP